MESRDFLQPEREKILKKNNVIEDYLFGFMFLQFVFFYKKLYPSGRITPTCFEVRLSFYSPLPTFKIYWHY